MTSNQIAYKNALTAAEQAQASRIQAEAATTNAQAATRNAATNEATLKQRENEENRGFWSSFGSTLAGVGLGLLAILL